MPTSHSPPGPQSPYTLRGVRADVLAAIAVTFTAVPQGIAYALIAGLPPAMGLYAACLPAIVGSLVRSSGYLVAGPTNAVSLLVGAGLAQQAGIDPVVGALSLCAVSGVMQVLAGVFKLSGLVAYLSTPVVTGYMTGAAVLIIIGQLPHLTGTAPGSGGVLAKVLSWVQGLGGTVPAALGVGLGVSALVVALRRIDRRIPGPIVALVLATLLSASVDMGLQTIGDLSPIPKGLPPLTVPALDQATVWALLPLALATAVLTLVETSALARSLATQTGESVDLSREFVGQGLATIAAGCTGGYPVSASLARSTLNAQMGARSRLSGVFSGVLMALVLLAFGPLVNHTPIAALAGLLLVIATDVIQWPRIREALRGLIGDSAAFVATFVGTLVLPLDLAIYAGVGISLLLLLRQLRQLRIHRMVFDEHLHLREAPPGQAPVGHECPSIRILNIEGNLFFAAAGQLASVLGAVPDDPLVRVVVLRLKRIQGFDVTAATSLKASVADLKKHGVQVILVGVQPGDQEMMRLVGLIPQVGPSHLFLSSPVWGQAMNKAIARAVYLVPDHACLPGCPAHQFVLTWSG